MRPVADRAGFSLVELLVALVLGGIITSVLFQLISGQGRFVELQSAREEVQQNSRAALELIGAELRTLPGGDALVLADDDEVTVRTPRIWGVVCAVTGASSFDMVVPAVAGASYSVNAGTGVVVNLGTAAAPVWTNPVPVTAIAGGTCNGAAFPVGSEGRAVTLTSMPENGGSTPAAGHMLYLYDQVTYRTGTSPSVPGLWIQRRIGNSGSNQPMAGPISEGGSGLRFEYFTDASPAPLPTPINDAATRRDVTRVSVFMEAVSRNQSGDSRATKADTVMISLRNRL